MSIVAEIVELEGNADLLSKVLYFASRIGGMYKKKELSVLDVQKAICMLFTDEKRFRAVTNGTNTILEYHYIPKGDPRYIQCDICLNVIKRIVEKYDIKKVDRSAVYYLIAVYQNIDSYVEEEFTLPTTYDITVILYYLDVIASYKDTYSILHRHLDFLMEILSPNAPININWNIDRTKEELETELYKVSSCRKLSAKVIQRLLQL